MKAELKEELRPKGQMGFLLLFFSSLGIGYSLVSQFVYNKPKSELLVVMICLLVAGIASRLREKHSK